MICERCGTYAPDDNITCEKCGALLPRRSSSEAGVQAMRQGKGESGAVVLPPKQQQQIPFYDDFGEIPKIKEPDRVERSKNKRQQRYANDAGRPTMKRGVPTVGGQGTRAVRSKPIKTYQVQRHMVNWTHVTIYIIIFLIVAAAGLYAYVNYSPSGQRILARAGKDAPSQAYWQVGEEYLHSGYIDNAIAAFEDARALDGESNINVDGLLLLGSAYEAGGYLDMAEVVYVALYETIVPSRPEAYRNVIRLMLADGRGSEAAELMSLAYEKTGQITFRQQREQFLPEIPKTSLAAGRYNTDKQMELTSAQGYDIYYTFDSEAVLPDEGTLYTGIVTLTEGLYSIRAVCVNGTLVSDPLSIDYRVVMPSPDAPNSNLAPNTYKTQRKNVRMRAMGDDRNVTIYYTVDGSDPDADSPIWTDEPIIMANGKATLKGISVNQFGKESNIYECSINTKAKPYPLTMFGEEDTFGDFTIMKTTREQFEANFGTPTSEEEISHTAFAEPCKQLNYSWGYAVVGKNVTGWLVCGVHMTKEITTGPRNTGIGSTMDQVIGKFRDMLQVTSPSGNRGLYGDSNGNRGKLYKQADGSYVLEYVGIRSDNRMLILDYKIVNDNVTEVTIAYK